MKTPERIVLRMDGNYNLANAIRRSVEEIPILSIDEVEIFKNDSALYDEFLAHRIGLIPLKTDDKMSEKTSIDLTLKKSGPGLVYASDFQGDAKVIYDKIPLTLLEKGQELEVIATARLGKGIEHAKNTPGLCYYRHLLEVSANPQIDNIVKDSKGMVKAEKKGSKWVCDLNDAEIDEINKIDPNAISDGKELLFFIESWGQIDAEKILRKAIEALNSNLKEFEKSFK